MWDGVKEEMKIDAHFDSLQPPEGEPIMKTCPICGNEFNEEYFENAACDSCLFKAATYENALSWGAEEEYEIEINGFLAYSFTVKEVEEILQRELEEKGNVFVQSARNSLAFDFCTDDKSAFADWLVEQKGKS